MYRRILVASDGSPGAAKAVETAILLARRFKAELHMICVEDLPGVPATVDEVVEEKSEANHRFEAVVARLASRRDRSASSSKPMSWPAARSRASSSLSSGEASTCSSSASWAIRRSTMPHRQHDGPGGGEAPCHVLVAK